MNRAKFIIFIIFISILFSINITGCSKKESPEQKPGAAAQQKPKAPSVFTDIRTDLDTIISELEIKSKMEETSSLQQKAKVMTQIQSQKQASNGGKQSSPKQSADWEKEAISLKNIHRNWNILEPDAMKAGLSSSKRNEFEKYLDELTTNINRQDLDESVFTAINLYLPYADVAEVFDIKTPPELFRLKYEVMSSVAEAKKETWAAANQRILKINEYWDNVRISTEENQKQLTSRTEFSIKDLEHALGMEEIALVMLKGEIVVNNLDQLEKSL